MEDFDSIISLEDSLIALLPRDAKVDGHDTGSGEMNLFIYTDSPEATFATGAAIIRAEQPHREFRAAYREMTSDDYHLLWPHDLTEFHIV